MPGLKLNHVSKRGHRLTAHTNRLATSRVADTAASQAHNDRGNKLSRFLNVVPIFVEHKSIGMGSQELVSVCVLFCY